MKFHHRVTGITVLPEGEPIHCRESFLVEIIDEGGEFLQVTGGEDGTQKLEFDPEEWPALRDAIETLLSYIAENEYEKEPLGPVIGTPIANEPDQSAPCVQTDGLLWKLMHDDHGLLLTDDECHQIERAVDADRKTQQP